VPEQGERFRRFLRVSEPCRRRSVCASGPGGDRPRRGSRRMPAAPARIRSLRRAALVSAEGSNHEWSQSRPGHRPRHCTRTGRNNARRV